MVKFPLHAELQNSWADQTLMSKIYNHSGQKWYGQIPIPFGMAKVWPESHSKCHCKRYGPIPIPCTVAKLMGNLPFSNYYRQYNSNYL